jgi:hypothetical protein
VGAAALVAAGAALGWRCIMGKPAAPAEKTPLLSTAP